MTNTVISDEKPREIFIILLSIACDAVYSDRIIMIFTYNIHKRYRNPLISCEAPIQYYYRDGIKGYTVYSVIVN